MATTPQRSGDGDREAADDIPVGDDGTKCFEDGVQLAHRAGAQRRVAVDGDRRVGESGEGGHETRRRPGQPCVEPPSSRPDPSVAAPDEHDAGIARLDIDTEAGQATQHRCGVVAVWHVGQGAAAPGKGGGTIKAEYGIPVTVVRDVDNTLATKLDAEDTTGSYVADVVAVADPIWVETKGADGWFAEPTGPAFDEPDYDRATNVAADGSFISSAAVLTLTDTASGRSALA